MKGFPLQDEGPGMNELFHDLRVEQEQERAARAACKHEWLVKQRLGPVSYQCSHCGLVDYSGKRP